MIQYCVGQLGGGDRVGTRPPVHGSVGRGSTALLRVPPSCSPPLFGSSPQKQACGGREVGNGGTRPGGRSIAGGLGGSSACGHGPLDTKYAFVDIHAIISLGRVIRLLATVHSTQNMRPI